MNLDGSTIIRGSDTIVDLAISGTDLLGAAIAVQFRRSLFDTDPTFAYASPATITITSHTATQILATLTLTAAQTLTLPSDLELVPLFWAVWILDSNGLVLPIDNGKLTVKRVAIPSYPVP